MEVDAPPGAERDDEHEDTPADANPFAMAIDEPIEDARAVELRRQDDELDELLRSARTLPSPPPLTASLPALRPICTSELEARWEAEADELNRIARPRSKPDRPSHMDPALLPSSLSAVVLQRSVSASLRAMRDPRDPLNRPLRRVPTSPGGPRTRVKPTSASNLARLPPPPPPTSLPRASSVTSNRFFKVQNKSAAAPHFVVR